MILKHEYLEYTVTRVPKGRSWTGALRPVLIERRSANPAHLVDGIGIQYRHIANHDLPEGDYAEAITERIAARLDDGFELHAVTRDESCFLLRREANGATSSPAMKAFRRLTGRDAA